MAKPTIKILPVLFESETQTGHVEKGRENNIVFDILASIQATAFEETNRVAFDGDEAIPLNLVLFGPTTEAGLAYHAEQLKTKLRDDKTFMIFVAVVPATTSASSPEDAQSKPVEDEGNIVSFAAWHFYEEPQPIQDHVDQEWPHSRCPTALNEFSGAFVRERNRFMGGKRYAHLDFLATLPEYQRQGIGKELLRHGLQETRERDLPVWLESSADGYSLYRSFGFEDMVSIDIDLAKFGSKGIPRHVCMLKPLPE